MSEDNRKTDSDFENFDDGNNEPKRNSPIQIENGEELRQKIIDIKNEGNNCFANKDYQEAIKSYSKALELCHHDDMDDRQTKVILFSNIAAAKDHLELSEEAIDFCTKALELNANHQKALLRRAHLYKKCDRLDESLADFNRFYELCPNDHSIRPIVIELKARIEERNEKMKTEMLSKLKNLGNMVLKPFGLSTDNFQCVQNPETGSYSVNFQSNNNPK